MPDSTEETDVGHAGWISGCVLLSFFLKKKAEKRDEASVGIFVIQIHRPLLSSFLLSIFKIERERRRWSPQEKDGRK